MSKLAVLFVILGATLWGSQGIYVRTLSAGGLSVYDICAMRIVGSAVVLTALMLIFRPRLLKLKISDIWICIGSGMVSIAGFNACYYNAIELTSLGVAAVLMYISPAVVTLFSCLLFKERFTKRKALSLVLALTGTGFVSGIFGSAQHVTTAGVLWGLGSGFCYASYSIFSVFGIRRQYHPLTLMSWTFIIAALCIAPLASPGKIISAVSAFPFLIVPALCLVLLCTLIAYLFYTTGLAHMEAGRAAVLAVVEAVAAALFGIALFDDPLTLNLIIGIAAVLASTAILNLGKRP